ncbi:MAG: ChaN family lipoprotein [Planctomycetota bacterium]|nr:ChaN family lipoprotein [Planctomycetota bacterium]
MSRLLVVVPLFLLSVSCATVSRSGRGVKHVADWSAPPLHRAVSVRHGRTGEALSFGAFLDALARADVVFLGEMHTDETTHRVELAVYEGLLARRGGKVVLAMEMFERDVQPALDGYLAGRIDEAAFLSRARPWINYRTGYRPLIEKARASGSPVVASNFPKSLRRRVGMEGPEVLETLKGDAKREAPAELFPNTPAYWRRVDNAVRSHRAMMGDISGDEQRLYSTQSLWDNSMGEACALALDEHAGYSVLHVNGGFHSAYWDGTVRQLLLRRPRTHVITVAISPVMNPSVAEVVNLPTADYVVFAEARATDLSDGTWSVYVPREQEYRFHLPAGASDDKPVPLLFWLSDDGFTAPDGMDLWKDRLGDEVAIAVLEPPYPGIQPNLSKGGRWYWPDTFPSDIGALIETTERMWGYLLRHYPIDPSRVCLAGEGTGATVVAAIGLLTDRMAVDGVALNPRQYAKIKDFPLPLPEFRGDDTPPEKTLRVVMGDSDNTWWTEELGEYVDIGLDAALVAAAADPWMTELHDENALRAALGIEARPASEATERRYILIEQDSPRARHWARLRALRAAADGRGPVAVLNAAPDDETAGRITIEILAESFAAKGALPKCPGPFGGTTVVVIPEGTSAEQSEAWLAFEEDDPITRHSRFHRLRIATGSDDRTLPAVLKKLNSENRQNVLIVPATFCADSATMRTLQRSVRTFEDQMTLHWLPGLGGRKAP